MGAVNLFCCRHVVILVCPFFQCLPNVIGGSQGFAPEANCSLISRNVVLQRKKLYTTSDFLLGHVFQNEGVQNDLCIETKIPKTTCMMSV